MNGGGTFSVWLIHCLFLLITTFCFAQEAPPVFDLQTCMGGSSYDAAAKLLRTTDGGYLVVGTTYSNNGDVTGNHGNGDVFVVKLDSLGAKQWKKTLGGSGSDVGVSATQSASGKIFIVANTTSTNGNVTYNHGLTDIWLVALSSGGTLLYQKTFGGSGDEVAHSIVQTNDGNLLIGGSSDSNNGDVTGNHGSDDYWVLKVDTLADLLWEKSLGGTGIDECNSVVATADGGYFAAGNSNSTDGNVSGNHGNNDFWVVKMDSSGTIQWEKSYGGSMNESALAAIQNTAGNFIVAGYTNSNNGDVTNNKGSSDYWMIMLDSTGTLLNQHTYGGSNSDVAYSLLQASDGGYLLSGSTISNDSDVMGNHGSEDMWLMKTDAGCNLNWARCYGGSMSDRALSAVQADDGGFVVAGYTYSNNQQVSGNHGSSDMWVFKLSCLSPVSSFVFADDTVCINSLINFTNVSVNSAVSSWLADGINFSNNLNASFQFDTVKTYVISLVAATCYAKDTFNQNFTVIAHPVPQITTSKSYLCPGDTITLSTTNFGSLLWSTGDTTASILVSSATTDSLTVTTHQCSRTSSITITQRSAPQLSLGNDTTFCDGSSFPIRAPSGFATYLWQNGSTDSIFNANTDGTYSVTVSDGYCYGTDSITLSTIVCMYPVAEFKTAVSSFCENTCINYTDQSSYATSWSWSFQGATPDTCTAQNPANICYNSAGTYSVSLTVTNIYGTSSESQNGYIVVSAYPSVPLIAVNGYFLMSSSAAFYQWYSNGTALANAINQSYTATQSGYYYVRTGNGTSCYSYSDSVYVMITGIENAAGNAANDFFVYPNPANDRVFILERQTNGKGAMPDAKLKMLKITDEVGKVVFQKEFTMDVQQQEFEISTANLANGIYFLNLDSQHDHVVMKLAVTH